MTPENEIIYAHCLARAMLFNRGHYGRRNIYFGSWQVLDGLLSIFGIGQQEILSSKDHDPTSIVRAIYESGVPKIFGRKTNNPHEVAEIYWNYWQMVGHCEKISPENQLNFIGLVINNGNYSSPLYQLQLTESRTSLPPEIRITPDGGTNTTVSDI